ncbi:MAG: DUF4080 domain-containing protein [Spirochaetia bacterium]|jgi:radical SAM superfamily enzyme YgiQ (UPF0313 family)|nr:DUF4080 domain-containing protein [Spirochaetia bacterium]
MRILLVAINARYTHSSLALRYLRNALLSEAKVRAFDIEILVREYNISQPRMELTRDIASTAPDMLMGSCYIWNADHFDAILPDVRALLPLCRLVLGGPEAAYRADDWLTRHKEIDLVVRGSAEGAAALITEHGFDLSGFPERKLDAPNPPFRDVPFPYTDDDFLQLEKHYLYYESSRGCPFRCSYCLSSRDDQKLDEKDVDTVIAEIERIARHEPFLVKFVDRSFNAHPKRARAIWRHIIREHADGPTRYHFEVHPLFLEIEDFALLANASDGLFQFELGVQTVHAVTRTAIERGGDWPREREAIRRLLSLATVHVHLDLIAGLPGESIIDIGESFNELMILKPDQLQLGFLKGLPGTTLREKADKACTGTMEMITGERSLDFALFQTRPPYEVLETASLSAPELDIIKGVEELVDSLYNSKRFIAEMDRAATKHGGHFAAYQALGEHCRLVGFNIRTRDKTKLEPLLSLWLGAMS